MAIVFASNREEHVRTWVPALRRALVDTSVYLWPDVPDARAITHAVVWQPEPDMLTTFPNLRAVFSLGAGVDDLLAGDVIPAGVPLVRMVDPELTRAMAEYVLLHVLYLYRQVPDYRAAQLARTWQPKPQRRACEVTVGVLGMGVLGTAAATAVARMGFEVIGFSRTPRDGEIACLSGAANWQAFLGRCEILVCLLPRTPDTLAMLDAQALAALPRGAGLICASRGGIVVEDDLLAALDAGQIRHAVLDVFAREPLPAVSPLWVHPSLTITPHIAAVTYPATAIESVLANLRRDRVGEPLTHVVDRARGY